MYIILFLLSTPSTTAKIYVLLLLSLTDYIFSIFLGVPDVPKHCELRNDSVMEVICQAGHDGGLQQHFVLEAIGATSNLYFNNLDSTRSTHELLDNEISTMNDQVSVTRCTREAFIEKK